MSNNVVQKAFNEVVFAERIHQIAYSKCADDPEYQAAHSELTTLLAKLEDTLSTNQQKELLHDLESAYNNMYSYFLEYSYLQGIKDSKMLHKELKKYGFSIVEENLEEYVYLYH